MDEFKRYAGKLEGKCAIVTGGSRGIGASIAKAFAVERASVAIFHDDDGKAVQDTLSSLLKIHPDSVAFRCDIRDSKQIQESVDAVFRWRGGADILVNCAGVGGGSCLLEDTLPASWDHILEVNLTGAYLMARACFPLMIFCP